MWSGKRLAACLEVPEPSDGFCGFGFQDRRAEITDLETEKIKPAIGIPQLAGDGTGARRRLFQVEPIPSPYAGKIWDRWGASRQSRTNEKRRSHESGNGSVDIPDQRHCQMAPGVRVQDGSIALQAAFRTT